MRRTLAKEVAFEGIGIHTGTKGRIVIKPYDQGIVFQKEGRIIPATYEYVVSTERRVVLEKDGVRVETVEHVLSALNGMGITDALLEVEGDEVPIMDGSAYTFAKAIKEVGYRELGSYEHAGILNRLELSETKARIHAEPSDKLEVAYAIVYEHSFLPSQFKLMTVEPETYLNFIAPARTFVFEEELEEIYQKGLAKGGSLENALVITKDGYANEPRFPDEPVRHKILDLIGDIALLGRKFIGRISCIGGGHNLHVKFVKHLYEHGWFGPTLDIEHIKELIPHRYPFLLVDRIVHLDESRAVGIKAITYNEQHFHGHFPNFAVMPGVLVLEAIAQVGAIMFFYHNKDRRESIPLFAGLDEVKFRRPVRPGELLYLEVKVLRPGKRFIRMEGRAYTEEGIVAQGIFTAVVS